MFDSIVDPHRSGAYDEYGICHFLFQSAGYQNGLLLASHPFSVQIKVNDKTSNPFFQGNHHAEI